jgi:hypothetical protein
VTSTATARDAQRRRERERAAARARAERQRRRRRWIIGGSIAGVVAVVAAMFGIAALTGGSSDSGKAADVADGTAIARMLADTPAATVSSIGLGTSRAFPVAIKEAPPRTANGKPEILYLGGDYCPYCAAERWPLVLALSRFGSFSRIGQTTSAHADVYPDTPTFSFHDNVYTSDYLTFTGRELYSNQRLANGRYATLDKATKEEKAMLVKYGNAFPLINFGGRYVQLGASYDPKVLKGLTAEGIAMAVADPKSPVAQGVAGSANVLTAAICKATGGQPTSVCTDPAVVAATAKLRG